VRGNIYIYIYTIDKYCVHRPDTTKCVWSELYLTSFSKYTPHYKRTKIIYMWIKAMQNLLFSLLYCFNIRLYTRWRPLIMLRSVVCWSSIIEYRATASRLKYPMVLYVSASLGTLYLKEVLSNYSTCIGI